MGYAILSTLSYILESFTMEHGDYYSGKMPSETLLWVKK